MSGGAPLPFLEAATWELAEGRARARGRLPPPGHPIYAGHFPGEPILPAIGQLALLQALLSLEAGAPAPQALTEIPHLKLRRTLLPGQEVEIEIAPAGEGGERRFALRSEGAPVAAGALRAAAEARPAGRPGDEAVGDLAGDALAQRLPHAAPARFLAAVEPGSNGEIAGTGVVPFAHALIRAGWAPSFLALEAGAQAAGVLEAGGQGGGAGRRRGEAPSVGYVVGIRDAVLNPAPFAAGQPFRITARRTGGAGSLAVYEVAASNDAGTIATATLSAFLPGTGGEA